MSFLRGFTLGRVFGIPMQIHPTAMISLAIVTVALGRGFREDFPALSHAYVAGFAITTALLVHMTLFFHELGHALAARFFGIQTERISINIIGGAALLKGEEQSPMQGFVIAIAGPVVSFLCALGFGIPLMMILSGEGKLAASPLVLVLKVISVANLLLAIVNLAPGLPLDGGRVLRAILWGLTGNYVQATRICSLTGQAIACGIASLGVLLLFGGQVTGLLLVIVGIFLFSMARMSLQSAQFQAAFHRLLVKDLMRPITTPVPAESPLSDVVRKYIVSGEGDRLPVVRAGTLIGCISAERISRIERSRWEHMRAEDLVTAYPREEILTGDMDALGAWRRLTEIGRQNLPVFHGTLLIGELFAKDVRKLLGRF